MNTLETLEELPLTEAQKKLYEQEALKLENQMCFPLYACARLVTNLYTPYLKPLGITYTQYLVFMVLWENDDIKVGELCSRLYLDSGTITPLLKKMEEKGYVNRYRCADDERCVKVKLTDDGRALKAKMLMIPASVGTCVNLDPKEAVEFKRMLDKILTSLA